MNSEHAKLMKEARYERPLTAPIHVKCSEQGNRQGQKAAAREEGGGGIGSSCEQLELLRPVVPQPCEDGEKKKKNTSLCYGRSYILGAISQFLKTTMAWVLSSFLYLYLT